MDPVKQLPEIDHSQYLRYLGYPKGHTPPENSQKLMIKAKEWFTQNVSPHTTLRKETIRKIKGDKVELKQGTTFSSSKLAEILSEASSEEVLLLGLSLGPEVDMRLGDLWSGDRVDQAFFIEAYALGLMDKLSEQIGVFLCDWAGKHKKVVLPPYGPGYSGWDLDDQFAIHEILYGHGQAPVMQILESGMLLPEKSILKLYGLTKNTNSKKLKKKYVPCISCDQNDCTYRVAPRRNQ